jgi:transposase InsO family protein
MVVSDTLSRAPIPDTTTEIEPADMVHHINSIIKDLPISNARHDQFKMATAQDDTLQAVIGYVSKGWPSDTAMIDQNVKPYYSFREELSLANGLLLKGNRIVVPKVLRQEMKELIHQGHQGIEKCRKRARQSLYWPRLNHEIDEMVSKCDLCLTHRNKLSQEPLISHEIPNYPWLKLASDLFELKSRQYLLVVDYFSKFAEVALLSNPITSQNVISSLKKMFSRHGIPKEIVSDGGPQYSAKAFKKFMKEWDIEHNPSSPHYPQSNGQAERFVQTIKATLRKACEGQEDPYLALLAINTTPGSNGKSPAQILYNRPVRTLIPSVARSTDKQAADEEHPAQAKQATQLTEKPLTPGVAVRIRYDTDKSWEKKGIVVSKRKEPRSYDVLNEKGNVLRVNNRHLIKDESDSPPLRIIPEEIEPIEHLPVESNESSQPSISSAEDGAVRTRSGRGINKPLRYR